MKLQPGDYVLTEDLTGGQYHAVAQAFIDAGAEQGEYPDWEEATRHPAFGWSKNSGELFHYAPMGHSLFRQLTVDQILGTTEPEWNGEGLPPVGAVCEFWSEASVKWMGPATVFHISRTGVCFVEYENAGWDVSTNPARFRPIPSEEDKAVEEMLGHIKVRRWAPSDIARDLYRAGYRKTTA